MLAADRSSIVKFDWRFQTTTSTMRHTRVRLSGHTQQANQSRTWRTRIVTNDQRSGWGHGFRNGAWCKVSNWWFGKTENGWCFGSKYCVKSWCSLILHVICHMEANETPQKSARRTTATSTAPQSHEHQAEVKSTVSGGSGWKDYTLTNYRQLMVIKIIFMYSSLFVCLNIDARWTPLANRRPICQPK